MSNKTKTQLEVVLDMANKVGYIDNFWAINHFILRLGAIIYKLKARGYKFYGKFGYEVNKKKADHKNYYYFID